MKEFTRGHRCPNLEIVHRRNSFQRVGVLNPENLQLTEALGWHGFQRRAGKVPVRKKGETATEYRILGN